MKNLALTVLVVLLLTVSVVAGNAQSVIYQDNFQGNDYASRYTTDISVYWQPPWQYVSLSGGGKGLAPNVGQGDVGFNTTSYLNGGFTNTSYSAQVSFECPNNVAPQLNISLLNNGWVGETGNSELFLGYDAQFYNQGSVVMGLTRCNADGTQTTLVPMNWSTPLISDANLAVFSTLTASVNVLPGGDGYDLHVERRYTEHRDPDKLFHLIPGYVGPEMDERHGHRNMRQWRRWQFRRHDYRWFDGYRSGSRAVIVCCSCMWPDITSGDETTSGLAVILWSGYSIPRPCSRAFLLVTILALVLKVNANQRKERT